MRSEEEQSFRELKYEEAIKVEKLLGDLKKLEQEERSLSIDFEMERRRSMSRPPGLQQDNRYAEMMAAKASKLEKLRRQRQDLMLERDIIDSDLEGIKTDKQVKPRPPILQSMQRLFPDRTEKLRETDQVLDENILDKIRQMQPNSREVSSLLKTMERDKQRLLQLHREHNLVLDEIQSQDKGEAIAQSTIEMPSKRYLEEARERLMQETQQPPARSTLLPPIRDAKDTSPAQEQEGQTTSLRRPLPPPPLQESWPVDHLEAKVAEDSRRPAASMVGRASETRMMPKPANLQTPLPALARPSSLQEEIRQLRNEYLLQGGRNQSLLEAIEALEREAALAQLPSSRPSHPPVRTSSVGQGAQRGDERVPAWFSEEMSKFEQYIQERKAENMKLKAQLEHVSGRSALATDRTERKDEVSFRIPLMEEEEELRQLEMLPKSSAIYDMRKQHLKEVIEMKYKLQQLKQEAEKTELENQIEEQRKEHERRKWVLMQQQQLLEAKYRKHFARENPIESLGGKEAQSEAYNFEAGFAVFFDYILGLPTKVNNQVQVVFGFYLGQEPKTSPKALPMTDVDVVGISSRRAVLALKRQFMKVSPNSNLKLIVEVQSVNPATLGKGPKMVPIGWTMLPVFTDDDLNRGLFRVPAFMPPVRPDLEKDDVAGLYRMKGMEFYLRLVPRQLLPFHDKFTVNPETTQVQYKYPKGLAPPAAEPPRPLKDHFVTPTSKIDASPGQITRSLSKPRPASKLEDSGAASLHSAVAPALEEVEPAWPLITFCVNLQELDGSLFENSHCSSLSFFFFKISLVLLQDGAAEMVPFQCQEVPREAGQPSELHSGTMFTSSPCEVAQGPAISLQSAILMKDIPVRENLTVMIELVGEVLTTGEERTRKEQPIAWTSHSLFRRELETELELNEDTFETLLLVPPLRVDKSSVDIIEAQKEQARLLSMDGLCNESSDMFLNSPIPRIVFSVSSDLGAVLGSSLLPAGTQELSDADRDALRIFDAFDSEPWLPAPKPPLLKQVFTQDDGFDVYVDAARHLPDNTTLSAVTCFLANKHMSITGQFWKEVDCRTADLHNPIFLARKEFRKEAGQEWDPTLTLVIRLDAVEKPPGEKAVGVGIVGFSLLNIFLDPTTEQQPDDSSTQEMLLNQGSFQVPVYMVGLHKEQPLSVRAMEEEKRRLCTTLLIRLIQAPRAPDGLSVLSSASYGSNEAQMKEAGLLVWPKPYALGHYSSESCSPTEQERYIYEAREVEPLPTIAELQTILEIEFTEEEVDATKNKDVFLPENFEVNLSNFRQVIRKYLKGKPATKLIGSNFNVPYFPEKGFHLSVDGFDITASDVNILWAACLVSSFPHGTYYHSEHAITKDVVIFDDLDLDSDVQCPRYQDAMKSFTMQTLNDKKMSAMIIDVRVVVDAVRVKKKMKMLKERKTVQLGFAIIPVIHSNYVMSGNYRVPVYTTRSQPFSSYFEKDQSLDSVKEGPTSHLLEFIENGVKRRAVDSRLADDAATGQLFRCVESSGIEQRDLQG